MRLAHLVGRPNVMIKVPATPEGIPAIRALTAQGVSVNVTLIFSLLQYEEVVEAYVAGLEDRVAAMDDAAGRQHVERFPHNVIGEIAPDPRQIAAPESLVGRACDRSVLG